MEQGEERGQRVWGARVNKQVQPGPILALLMQPMWGPPIHMKRRASTAVFALFAQRLSSNASRSLLAVQLLHDAISVFVKELRAGGPMREGASAAEAAEQQSSSGAAAAAQGPAAAGGGAAQAAAPKEAPKEAAKTSKPAAGGSGGHELRLKERFYAGASDLYECFTDARRIMAFTQSPAEAQVWWGEAGQAGGGGGGAAAMQRMGAPGGVCAEHGSSMATAALDALHLPRRQLGCSNRAPCARGIPSATARALPLYTTLLPLPRCAPVPAAHPRRPVIHVWGQHPGGVHRASPPQPGGHALAHEQLGGRRLVAGVLKG